MSPWIGIGCYLAAFVASVLIRAPHTRRSNETPVRVDRTEAVERILLFVMFLGALVVPLLYCATSIFEFADYPLRVPAFAAGLLLVAIWLTTFYRSHSDLGANWSVSLEMREKHELVVAGIYQRVRHPMYTSLFANGFAQALLLPNWIAGPSFLVAFTILFACRLRREEQMLTEAFGDEYRDYARRTKRLVPGVW